MPIRRKVKSYKNHKTEDSGFERGLNLFCLKTFVKLCMHKFNTRLATVFIPCLALMTACNPSGNNQAKSTAVLDTVSLSSKSFALAYQDGNKIVATSIDTMKQISFGGAEDPAISPDGNKLAYTVTDSTSNRSIWVADLENKSQLQLQANGKNYYGAVWSPDGNTIAFSVLNDKSIWKVGLIKADNTGLVVLDDKSNIAVSSPTWKSANEIVAHDLTNLFTFDLTGKITGTKPLAGLIGANYNIASDNSFFYSNDGKTLVFSAYAGESVAVLKGQVNSVFVMDLVSKVVKRISPEGMYVSHLFVSADDRIFYSGEEKPYTQSKIYISDLDGNIKTIVDKGKNPTVASK